MRRFAKESDVAVVNFFGRDKMKKSVLKRTAAIPLAAFLIFLAALSFSCKGKETTQEKKQGLVTNPYSVESVFIETKQRADAHPQDADALFHLADLYERNGQYAEAIDIYKKVAKLKPGGYVYLKIGTAHDRLGQPGEAVTAIKKAIQYMPGYAVAYNNLGIAYGNMGKDREEIAALNKALQLRPSYVTARYNLGIAYLRVKDRKAALQQYELLKDIESGPAEELRKKIDSTP
jgi:tetratricopeptide (TPR) repeat protein